MELIKFNTLYKEILLENSSKIIKYNTFQYKFEHDDSNKTFCIFKSIDKSDNKLINIKVTIFENNTYEFEVTKNDKSKTYTDKEFLLAYYKEYQDFKKALSQYKKESAQQAKDEKNNKQKNIIDGKTIPEIKNFNEILSQINNTEDGILIKIDGTAFTIKQVIDKKYKNLLTISFSFNNENALQNETDLQTYDAIALVKIADPYIMILNINLYDPENLKQSAPVAKLTETQFKDSFIMIYFKLKKAMQQYLAQFLIDKKF